MDSLRRENTNQLYLDDTIVIALTSYSRGARANGIIQSQPIAFEKYSPITDVGFNQETLNTKTFILRAHSVLT